MLCEAACDDACIIHAGPDGDDFNLGFCPASTSLGLKQVTCFFSYISTERQCYPMPCKSTLIGDAFQTSMSKLTCKWCLLAYISFKFKLLAQKEKRLLLHTFWFQPPKPLLEINLNHWTSALKPKPKSIILMTSIINILF